MVKIIMALAFFSALVAVAIVGVKKMNRKQLSTVARYGLFASACVLLGLFLMIAMVEIF